MVPIQSDIITVLKISQILFYTNEEYTAAHQVLHSQESKD